MYNWDVEAPNQHLADVNSIIASEPWGLGLRPVAP